MKACPGFVLRELAGECMLMPAGDNIGRFRGMVLMNSLSAFVWKNMQTPVTRDELLAEILKRYEVDAQTAAADLDGLLEQFRKLGIMEE